MNRPMAAAAAALLASTALYAQNSGEGTGRGSVSANFQQSASLSEAGWQVFPATQIPEVTGHPFSATAVNRSTQTLGDGTHIDKTTTTLMYRDSEGRRRDETNGRVTITDPVAHVSVQMNMEQKTATKMSTGTGMRVERVGEVGLKVSIQGQPAGEPGARGGRGGSNEAAAKKKKGPNTRVAEDLGVQTVNGVLAHGVRTTMTIPMGAIGNDRDLKVVNETWTSDDLHMLIKSVNDDPRFGNTTYELTNIVLAQPDASLFEIPGDYSVNDQTKLTRRQVH